MGFLFFRNTHMGPNHEKFREDLPVSSRRTLRDGSTASGFFLLHCLDHEQGLTFDEIVAETRKYEAQFPEEDPMQIQDILEELIDSLTATVIRVEEQVLPEAQAETLLCQRIKDAVENSEAADDPYVETA